MNLDYGSITLYKIALKATCNQITNSSSSTSPIKRLPAALFADVLHTVSHSSFRVFVCLCMKLNLFPDCQKNINKLI